MIAAISAKYKVIYADPPWQFKTYSKKGLGKSADKHYPTMSLEDIKALPVSKLADKDCALFMWTTIPFLRQSFDVMESWGFEYKTVAFVGSSATESRMACFGEQDIGREQTVRSVCWRQEVTLSVSRQAFIRL